MFYSMTVPRFRKKGRFEQVGWSDFFDHSAEQAADLKSVTKYVVGAATVYVLQSSQAHASVQDMIVKAFDPIIGLMQGISYPVAFVMLSTGFILIMMGQRHKGLHMIKWAAVGYVGLQFAPAIMRMLVEVGGAMKAAK